MDRPRYLRVPSTPSFSHFLFRLFPEKISQTPAMIPTMARSVETRASERSTPGCIEGKKPRSKPDPTTQSNTRITPSGNSAEDFVLSLVGICVRSRLTLRIRRPRAERADDTTDAIRAVSCIRLVRPCLVGGRDHGFFVAGAVESNKTPTPVPKP
jgi:hypothetical protein